MRKLRSLLLTGMLAVLCAAAFVACEEDDPTLAGNNELVVTTPTGNDTLGMYRKPAAADASPVYSGDTVRLTLAHFVDSAMTVVGGAFGVNVGDYTCVVALKDTARYVWSDSTKDTVRIAWKITSAHLNVPKTAVVAYKHTGSEITLSLLHLDTARMTVSGNTATAAGDYECRISLKDPLNYMWNSGTATDVVIAWKIVVDSRTLLSKTPTRADVYYFEGESFPMTYIPPYFDTTVMRIIGSNTTTKSGIILRFAVALKDTLHYAWRDGSVDDVQVECYVWNDLQIGSYALSELRSSTDTIMVDENMVDEITGQVKGMWSLPQLDMFEKIKGAWFHTGFGAIGFSYDQLGAQCYLNPPNYAGEQGDVIPINPDYRIMFSQDGPLYGELYEGTLTQQIFNNLYFTDDYATIIFRYNDGVTSCEFIFKPKLYFPQ